MRDQEVQIAATAPADEKDAPYREIDTVQNSPNWVETIERIAAPLLLCLYALDVTLLARIQPLWFDELISYYVARLPSFAGIWEALRQTADGQPPLSHALMRASHLVFGPGEIGTRFPAMCAFAVMSWSLYAFVARRVGKAYGVAAMLFAWLTWGYQYAYEARPYSLLMAFCALSFLCWRATTENRRRGWALAGLGLSLAAALSSHYYAGLLFLPLGVGELVRTWRRKKIDWAAWGVLGLTPLCLLAYLPLALGVGGEYQQGFWSPVEWHDLYGFYLVLLAPASLPVLAALAAAGMLAWQRNSRTAAGPLAAPEQAFPAHERAAIYTLAVLPMVYVLATTVITGAFVYRYPLAALFGISVLFAEIFYHWMGRRREPVWAACAVLTAGFLLLRLAPTISLASGTTPLDELKADLETIQTATAGAAEPIVVSSPLLYLTAVCYAPAAWKDRLVYPADASLAVAFTQTNSPDVSLLKLAPWAPLHVPNYAEFRGQRKEFFVWRRKNARFDWIYPQLQKEGESLADIAEGKTLQLLHCCGASKAPQQQKEPPAGGGS